jgi:serine/threonine protein kinase
MSRAPGIDRSTSAETPAAPPPVLESTASDRGGATVGDSLISGVSEDFGFGGLPQAGDPWLGCEIGGARLVRLVGAGGMGRVYEATQMSPARRVAVKLARPESLTDQTARRLDREADVLATLEHPGIARIHAAGRQPLADGRGLPFLVMEFVPDARPITEWCQDRRLDQRGRLEMLLQVCDAVAHAHERDVVHRDIKPGNVLVDGDGRPRLVDFGIASWVAPAASTISAGARIAGTPAYMSPEQREGAPADARTDIYALGVLAAELLTDESPARAQVVLAARRDRLARIVQRCLELDPDARYGSVQELAAALRSQLERPRASAVWPPGTGRLILWAVVLAAELLVLAALVFRGRLAPPVSPPVFDAERASESRAAR